MLYHKNYPQAPVRYQELDTSFHTVIEVFKSCQLKAKMEGGNCINVELKLYSAMIDRQAVEMLFNAYLVYHKRSILNHKSRD